MARFTHSLFLMLLLATSCATLSSEERSMAQLTSGPSGLHEVTIEALGLE